MQCAIADANVQYNPLTLHAPQLSSQSPPSVPSRDSSTTLGDAHIACVGTIVSRGRAPLAVRAAALSLMIVPASAMVGLRESWLQRSTVLLTPTDGLTYFAGFIPSVLIPSDLMLSGLISCGFISFGVIPFGLISSYLIPSGIISCGLVPSHQPMHFAATLRTFTPKCKPSHYFVRREGTIITEQTQAPLALTVS